MDNSGKRLQQFLQDKGIEQREVAKNLGTSPAYISMVCTGKKGVGKRTAKVLQDIFGVSSAWLLTGIGPMTVDEVEAQEKPVVSDTTGRPYFNVDFVAGFDLMVNDQTTTPDYLIDFAPFNGCDCWINARGDSMAPTISSGDIIALKRVQDFSVLINGEIYAIVTSSGLRTIKRVQDDGDTLTLIPDNPSVARQSIPQAIVTHAHRLLGSLKIF